MPTPALFLDADRLRAETFVRHVELHETLGSTSDRALELARTLPTADLPALVAARIQTAGRGRGRNTWWSGEGALTFSLLVDTAVWQVAQRDWPQLSLAMAAAVAEALRGEAPEARVQIKAPNDVLIDGRKVSGILIESPGGAAPGKARLIIGVGINVNNSWRHAPPEVCSVGTSLVDVTGGEHDPLALLMRLLQLVERQVCSDNPASHDS